MLLGCYLFETMPGKFARCEYRRRRGHIGGRWRVKREGDGRRNGNNGVVHLPMPAILLYIEAGIAHVNHDHLNERASAPWPAASVARLIIEHAARPLSRK